MPGSGEAGFVARSGPIPEGYYKDAKKSAETFREIQGRRWSIPGDWCTVNADGTLELHGRGSVCINSGGEKIFPEEIEETLKLHAAVADAVVVGVPDERWGEAVTALVELRAAHGRQRGRAARFRQAAPGGLQGAQDDRAGSQRGARAVRQGRLQGGQEARARGDRVGRGGVRLTQAGPSRRPPNDP